MIALAYGRAGLRDLGSRLLRWRVGVRWYAVALLTAPVLWTAIQGALSLTSDAFIPGIITTDDTASLLAAGLVVGLCGVCCTCRCSRELTRGLSRGRFP
ncbi:hypothetical protein PHK61_31380 [Actinomycetospora lutea]|uniref:hypothetical protein n=1 Tax=Actinomycetospora lutea TaxID=663604 RepID=UPI002366DCA7|nr:hypothetical protein [Actinomycetospora lutea]MDD7942922.1 hypothetical protein [Actinomycetospora lutea]